MLRETKQKYLNKILEEPEIGERKLRARYRQLFAYIDNIKSPSSFVERLYQFLNEVTPICAVEGCKNTPKFVNFKEGYRECCSYKCSTKYTKRGFNTEDDIKRRVLQAVLDQAAFDLDIQNRIDACTEICAGCGAVAKFYSPQRDRWRCVERVQECPATLSKMGANISASLAGVSRNDTAVKIEAVSEQLCHYGCGQLAQYRLTESCDFKLSCSAAHQACPAQRNRRSGFMQEKYKNPEAKNQFLTRLNASNQINHSVNWPMHIDGMKEKRELLCEEKWGPGLTNPMQVPVVKQIRGDAFEAKYGPGIRHNSQVPEFREANEKRLLNLSYKKKEYIFPSGKMIRIQGYEDMALDHLLDIFDEDQIRTSLNTIEPKIPRIEYLFKHKQINNHFYPDIFIPSINAIVEVKGEWTYYLNGDWAKNKAKELATKAAGYNFVWFVYKGRDKVLFSLEELEEIDQSQQALTK
jgi:hypothetical protein